VTFGPGGASLTSFTTSFDIDAGTPAGIVTVSVTSVPEPTAAALVALGLAALAMRRTPTEERR
jgi:MYXO-CTERM domain-containing protein